MPIQTKENGRWEDVPEWPLSVGWELLQQMRTEYLRRVEEYAARDEQTRLDYIQKFRINAVASQVVDDTMTTPLKGFDKFIVTCVVGHQYVRCVASKTANLV